LCGIGESRRKVFFEIFYKPDVAVRLVPDFRATEQIVGDKQAIVIKNNPNQASKTAVRLVDGVVENFAILGIDGDNASFGGPCDEIVTDDTTVAVRHDTIGAVGIPKADAGVAVDYDISLDDTVLCVKPHKHGTAPLTSPAPDTYEDIVTNYPVFGIHDIDSADVVTVGDIARIIA